MDTVGTIATRFGVPVHRVAYVVKAHGIKPAGRVANLRVFGQEEVKRIAAVLRK